MGRITKSRSIWFLISAQGLVIALLIVLNTYVLPRAGWDGLFGPFFMGQNLEVEGRAPRLESRVRTIVRTEIQQAVALQGDSVAVERLRRFYRMPQRVFPISGPQGAVGGFTPQSPPRQGDYLLPFGLHRPGLKGVGLYLASLITLFGVSALITYLFPGRLRTMRDSLGGGWRELFFVGAIGGLGYLVAAVLILLLATNVVGLSLAFVLLIGLVPGTLVGMVAFSLALGRWMRQKANLNPAAAVMELAVGVLALFPASIIPVVGWIFAGTAAILGFGALLATKFGSKDGWSIESLSQE